VIQEVGLAVARSDARPTCSEEVAPWLCKIAIRQCAMVIRTQARRQNLLTGVCRSSETQDSARADPIFWLLHREQREIVRSELAAMDAESRQLLVWKYVTGMSYEDIGLRLAVSRHKAEYRVMKARKQIRRRLQARGLDGGMLP
jgi:RNA polymerase sigma-70 factor (ECF subfamily)